LQMLPVATYVSPAILCFQPGMDLHQQKGERKSHQKRTITF
jgi:hypothetical protein